jgi:hypothetical protein
VPHLTVHFGAFRTHPRAMALVSPPPGGPNTVVVRKTEEKGSDVNLATFLPVDGFDGLYDEAIVITDDSDLAEPIRQANARFGRVHVLSPRTAATSELRQVAASYTRLHPEQLGHRNPALTARVYAHVGPEAQRAAVPALEPRRAAR